MQSNSAESQIFLLVISGQDKPGVTKAITTILANHNVRILDIGQSVIHKTLVLGFLIEVPGDSHPSTVRPELMAKGRDLEITVRLTPITEKAFEDWVRSQGKDRYIITLLGRAIRAEHLAKVTGIIADNGLNIDRIERLSGRMSLVVPSAAAGACVEFHASGASTSPDEMRAAFLSVTQDIEIDIAFQRESVFRRNRRLVVFDMDSTLLAGEVIDELAKLHGVGDEVSKITASAMRGEIDFKQSFTKRVSLLKGLPESRVSELLNTIPLADGAERLISGLKVLGYKTAILSGGFTFFGKYLQTKLGIDYVFANELKISKGVVTGEVGSRIVDGERKAELLRGIANSESLSLEQVIAVGDGANDLPMLNIAGMGIAFHAKPLVRSSARHAISTLGLDAILYLVGVRERDELLSKKE